MGKSVSATATAAIHIHQRDKLSLSFSTVSRLTKGNCQAHYPSVCYGNVTLLGEGRNGSATLIALAQLALRTQDALTTECGHKDQLVRPPLFGDEACPAPRDVVLSVHPKYSEKILQGQKTVELRRRFPMPEQSGITLYIYSTSPVQAMVGMAGIKEVQKLPVQKIWTEFNKSALIKSKDFRRYFRKLESGFVLILYDVRPFPQPIQLSRLREEFGFRPPQSFLYVKNDLRKALKNELPI